MMNHDPFQDWVPSMRALNESTSYEHYLELMKLEEQAYLANEINRIELFANETD